MNTLILCWLGGVTVLALIAVYHAVSARESARWTNKDIYGDIEELRKKITNIAQTQCRSNIKLDRIRKAMRKAIQDES